RPLSALAFARRAIGGIRDRHTHPTLRRTGQNRLGNPPLRDGPRRPNLAAPRPPHERSPGHKRRPTAAAEGLADLITGWSARLRCRRTPPHAGIASAGPAGRRGSPEPVAREAPVSRRRRTALPGRSHSPKSRRRAG